MITNANDALPRPTSRRGFLTTAALGASGLVIAGATRSGATPNTQRTASAASTDGGSCLTLSPTAEVGPFYVAYDHIRSNIRAGQSGVHLTLHIKVIDVSTCKPIHNAALDIWQANRLGVYSDEQQEDTVGEDWLRGIQLTDKHGRASFHTIMPGWYQGRVEHIHAKVRLHGSDSSGLYSGGSTTHIGQFFFPQKINDAVAKLSTYAANTQQRITNATDRVYTQQGGAESLLTLTGSTSAGYIGHITVGVNP
jgi:protocatechuate 3,4-dioxygenase beta subunit